MVQFILTCPDSFMWSWRIARSIVQDGDCWRWTGSLDRSGYGKFKVTGHDRLWMTGAHRASWLVHRGDIPEGLVTDHLCRNRWCVNPWHLELVTPQINTARGEHHISGGKKGRSGRKRLREDQLPSCGRHDRADGYDRTTKDGYLYWVCRICNAERRARYQAERQQNLAHAD